MPVQGKRKGMIVLHSSCFDSSLQSVHGHSNIQYRKPRGTPSLPRSERSRDVSLTTAIRELQINVKQPFAEAREHQAISRMEYPPLAPKGPLKSSARTAMQNIETESYETSIVLYQESGDSLVAPKTPSFIPVRSKQDALIPTPTPSPCKISKASPQKTPFLSKDSNITGFIAWDYESRVENMEGDLKQMKGTIDGFNRERNGLEDTITICKARSRFGESSSGQV
jgi:kinesin family protein C1